MPRARLLPLFLVVAALVAHGVTIARPLAADPEIDLSVNAIRLGSTYAEVIKNVGRTRKQERTLVKDDPCGAPYTSLSLSYDGLYIRMHGTPKGTDFVVVAIDVTSAKWKMDPGIGVGTTVDDLHKAIPPPERTTEVETTTVEHFVNKGNNGIANVFVKNGKVDRVSWEAKLC